MSKFFIYCRKSTEAEDRQVLSIESQTNEIKRLAEQRGLSIVEILTEARSAKAPGRSVFNKMMQRIYRGEAKGIICWKLDRLARNPIDGGAIIWAIKQHGLEIVTPTQSFSQSDDNTILMYIEFGMAQKYIDDLSRNVKRGLRTKVEKGWYPGIAPLGYLNNKSKDKGEKNLVTDPERFPLIRRMWDLMLTGLYAPTRILTIANNDWGFRTRQMRKQGGKFLHRSMIYRIFNDPFYYGWFEYPKGSGQWYKGKHEPMVTEEEFNRVQVLLGRRGNPRAIKHSFPFTGVIRCGECGSMVTAEEKHQLVCSACRLKFAYRQKERCPRCETPIEKMTSPRFLHYTYYHCTKSKNPDCSQGSVEAHKLDKQIAEYLSGIQLSERFKDWAISYLHEMYDHEMKARNGTIEAQQRAYQDCVKRLDNLVKLKTSPQNTDGSLLSDEEYGKQRFQLIKEKTQLKELLQDSGDRVEKWVETAEKIFQFASVARERFAKGDLNTKKEILLAIGSNLTLKDKKLFIEAKKPFLVLEKSLPDLPQDNAAFEPKIFRVNKRKRELVGSLSLTGCWRRDDVRTSKSKLVQSFDFGKLRIARGLVREVHRWVIGNQQESGELRIVLDRFFELLEDYQSQAA